MVRGITDADPDRGSMTPRGMSPDRGMTPDAGGDQAVKASVPREPTSTGASAVHPTAAAPVLVDVGFLDTTKAALHPSIGADVSAGKNTAMEMQQYAQPQQSMRPLYGVLAILALLVVAILGLTVFNTSELIHVEESTTFAYASPPLGQNVCAGKKPKSGYDNVQCAEAAVDEQAAADVSYPFKGTKETTAEPVLTAYWQAGLCPVNVHWHLGTEHRSAGQYDETGVGPANPLDYKGKPRQGLRCKLHNAVDKKFTKPYDWKHCKHMQVGETYEVHWPHSAAGACGTINQYQTPFYDGVFCTDDVITSTNKQIGVQAQVFTVVNDEEYYYPDLIRGMIVDGDKGNDMVFYTGSTTGDSRSNTICSKYAPITWQVDRTCHLISASSFDKMCADMKAQRDDMTDDLHPHGSREVVAAKYTANNMKAGSLSGGRATLNP